MQCPAVDSFLQLLGILSTCRLCLLCLMVGDLLPHCQPLQMQVVLAVFYGCRHQSPLSASAFPIKGRASFKPLGHISLLRLRRCARAFPLPSLSPSLPPTLSNDGRNSLESSHSEKRQEPASRPSLNTAEPQQGHSFTALCFERTEYGGKKMTHVGMSLLQLQALRTNPTRPANAAHKTSSTNDRALENESNTLSRGKFTWQQGSDVRHSPPNLPSPGHTQRGWKVCKARSARMFMCNVIQFPKVGAHKNTITGGAIALLGLFQQVWQHYCRSSFLRRIPNEV